MKTIYLVIVFFTVFLTIMSCNNKSFENDNIITKNTDTVIKDTLASNIVKDSAKIDLLQDTNLFNPNYKPFYGGITIEKILEQGYAHTASGPGNPFVIECLPQYRDSAIGVYYFHGKIEPNKPFGFSCDVNVSLFGEGFFGNDTTQRINYIAIYEDGFKLSKTFPFQVGQEIIVDNDSLKFVESNLYLYKEKDYEFYLFIQGKYLNSLLIRRLYCEDSNIDTDLIIWFKNQSLRNIREKERFNSRRENQQIAE